MQIPLQSHKQDEPQSTPPLKPSPWQIYLKSTSRRPSFKRTEGFRSKTAHSTETYTKVLRKINCGVKKISISFVPPTYTYSSIQTVGDSISVDGVPTDSTVLSPVKRIKFAHISFRQLEIVKIGIGVDSGWRRALWQWNETA